MGVQKFTQPDYSTQSGSVYPTGIDKAIAVHHRVGGAFAPHEQDAASPQPDLSVRLDAGAIMNGSTLTEVAAQTVSGFTIPSAGQHRIDRVVIDGITGVASRIAGTAVTGSPSATPPAITAGSIPICQVLITSADTAILNSMITDERVFISSRKQPTRTVLTSGSGTYTVPAGCTRINVRMVGAGAGGFGDAAGGAGNATTFGALTANGGGVPVNGGTAQTAAATASGGDINISGGQADTTQGGINAFTSGTRGAASAFGGGGAGGVGSAGPSVGQAGNAPGSGGGAGGSTNASIAGTGGNAGAYCEKLITAPAATYSYAVAAGGTAGAAGAQRAGGAAGAAGIIIIDEYYD